MTDPSISLGSLFTREFLVAMLRALCTHAGAANQQWYVKGGYACALRLAQKSFHTEEFKRLESIGAFDVIDVDCSLAPSPGQTRKNITQAIMAIMAKVREELVDPLCQAEAFHYYFFHIGIPQLQVQAPAP